MKRIDLVMVLSGVVAGILMACSANAWTNSLERGKVQAQTAKEDLIKSAGLFELHNAIYSKVGSVDWENRVKPTFMSRLTYATARETGNIIPEPAEVIDWVRAHPKESRRMLLEAAEVRDSFWQ